MVYIVGITEALELQPRHDITGKLDPAFKPRGQRAVAGIDFLGPSNLGRIERICAQRMERFGYSPSRSV